MTESIPPSIECRPLPAFYITALKGSAESASIELVSHERTPLSILNMAGAGGRFTTRLEILEKGRLFRLHVDVPADALPGRTEDKIMLHTSSTNMPTITVPVYIFVRERIHTFPDRLEFGRIRISDIQENRALAPLLSQILMVYCESGNADFDVTAETDVPFLKLSPTVAKHKRSCEVRVDVLVERLKPGPVQGSIWLKTTDPEFPVISIPVSAILKS